MSETGPWTTLQIGPTTDALAIRRAYSARLKVTNPEDDAEGFKALREAYDHALAIARHRQMETVAELQTPPSRRETRVALFPEALGGAGHEPEPTRSAAPHAPSLAMRHEEGLRRLSSLILAQPPAPADQIEEAISQVLSGEALESVDIYLQTDHWMADFIARNPPRSDVLIELAVSRFGWKVEARDRAANPAIVAIFQRREDIRFRNQLDASRHPLATASKILRSTKPRRDVALGLVLFSPIEDLHQLLAAIYQKHPSLQVDYPRETLAAWTRYFQNPRLSPPLCWTAGLAAGLLAVFIPLALRTGPGPAACVIGGVFFLLATPFIKLYAIDHPTRNWRRERSSTATAFERLGWAPSAIGIVAISALLPSSAWALAMVALLGLANVYWAAVTRVQFRGPSSWTPYVRISARGAPLALLLLLLGARTGPEVWPVLPSIATGMIAFVVGEQSMADFWARDLKALVRGISAAGLLVATAALAYWLGQSGVSATPAPTLIAAIGAMSMAVRLPASTAPPFVWRWNIRISPWQGIWLLIVGGNVLGGVLAALGGMALVLSSVIGVAWVVLLTAGIRLCTALYREAVAGRNKSRRREPAVLEFE